MTKPKYNQQFEEFWRQYPNVKRTNSKAGTRGYKPRAWRAWQGISMNERFAALEAVGKLERSAWLSQASVWLNNDGWTLEPGEDINKLVAQKIRDKQKQYDREHTGSWLREQTSTTRLAYAAAWPNHKWLVDEIEAENSNGNI